MANYSPTFGLNCEVNSDGKVVMIENGLNKVFRRAIRWKADSYYVVLIVERNGKTLTNKVHMRPGRQLSVLSRALEGLNKIFQHAFVN